jgi:hypothetical protein
MADKVDPVSDSKTGRLVHQIAFKRPGSGKDSHRIGIQREDPAYHFKKQGKVFLLHQPANPSDHECSLGDSQSPSGGGFFFRRSRSEDRGVDTVGDDRYEIVR